MINRRQTTRLRERLGQGKVLLLMGARQVGKTTLVALAIFGASFFLSEANPKNIPVANRGARRFKRLPSPLAAKGWAFRGT